MGRIIEPGIVRPSSAFVERLAASRLGLGDRRGDPRHYSGHAPGLGFWDGGISVPTDGPNSWYRPETAAHFTALGMNTPDVLQLCQDTSGAMVPTIDSLSAGNWTTNASGHLYQQTVTGWTAKFLGLDGAGAVQQRWSTSSSALDLSAGESYAMLAYVSFTMPSVDTGRMLIVQGTNNAVIPLSTTGKARLRWNALSATGSLDHSGLSTVHMYGVSRRADTDLTELVTDLETVTPTHDESAWSAQIKGMGSTNTTPCEMRFCWVAIWKGANAEFSMASYITTLRH